MKNTFGNSVTITLFGESHGDSIGAVLDGIPAGIKIDKAFIENQLSKRRPFDNISTSRVENDNFKIISGLNGEYTCGAPICIIIENENIKSNDYNEIKHLPRPSHSDYSTFCKHGKYGILPGGGHSSGRITAPIVAMGAIAIQILKNKGIFIGTHIKSIYDINDREFSDYKKDIEKLNDACFAVLDDVISQKMQDKIRFVKSQNDSVGGVLETAVIGLDGGVGEPWFDTLEGMLSHGLFSIPAVKGIEFGKGFDITEMLGSSANDELYIQNERIGSLSNNSGGICGGISNGEPIIFRLAVKPTPTILKEQKTVNLEKKENAVIKPSGRHDPCIVHRARVVADSITALVILDMLSQKYGAEGLK